LVCHVVNSRVYYSWALLHHTCFPWQCSPLIPTMTTANSSSFFKSLQIGPSPMALLGLTAPLSSSLHEGHCICAAASYTYFHQCTITGYHLTLLLSATPLVSLNPSI
jgi:hypothetical protein